MGENEQLSCINDLLIGSNGEVLYVGNSKAYVAELGPNLSNSGRVLSSFDKGKNSFVSSEKLPIPSYTRSNNINSLGKKKYLTASNDGYPQIFEID